VGGGLPLQGLKGYPDSVKIALRPAHLAGCVRVALVGLVRPTDELIELTLIL
jgi:hypothetical protein